MDIPHFTTPGKARYSLADLVGLERLQTIQDLFAEANGVAATIIELDGTPITRPSNHSEVCRIIRNSEAGLRNCMQSGARLGTQAAGEMRPFHKKCSSCGFSDAAAPIIVEGEHIANCVIGQYHIRDVDEQRVREYAREINADEEAMAAAFREMPTISTGRFEKVLDFLWVLANEIANMGLLNLKLAEQARELERTSSKLARQQQNLEETVAARTAELLRLNTELQREVTDRSKLQRMQSRLVAAVENADESIIITNTIPEILYVNPAFMQQTGYSREEVMGKDPGILKSGYHDREFYRRLWHTIENGETWKGRFRNKDKSGALHDEETTISPVKNDDGRIINYVSIKRDITQQLEMERQILQMSKMEAIGTLAAGIAHEINTPIQYVTDNTRFLEEVLTDLKGLIALFQALRSAVGENKDFAEQIDRIEAFQEEIDLDFLTEESDKAVQSSLEGLDRIATVVRAMKEFSHPGGREKEEVDINSLIESTVTVSTNEWKNCAEIDLDLDRTLPPVPVYSGHIKQALLNLVVNAAHAIAEKGSPDMGTIAISTGHSCNGIKIAISDTGTGIPEEIIDTIFDPFFTTKTVGKGTGQGLAMARSTIIEGHGGTLTVASELGRGSTFTLTLPVNRETGAGACG